MQTRLLLPIMMSFLLASAAWAEPASQPDDECCPSCAARRAATTQPDLTEAGRKNLATLNENLHDIRFQFSYTGPQDKPFYTVTLSVADFMADGGDPFVLGQRITHEQGERIVALLADSGWLNTAQDLARPPKVELPDGYVLQVFGYDRGRVMIGPMGLNATTYQRLEAIRKVVDGPAEADMDKLLGRISFLRPDEPTQ